MVSILVVAPRGLRIEHNAPDVELLYGETSEDAVEKLARNRRIDAVLILAPDASDIIAAIREENSVPPPLFVASDEPSIPERTSRLKPDPARALEALLEQIR
jgi:hypothetical protein